MTKTQIAKNVKALRSDLDEMIDYNCERLIALGHVGYTSAPAYSFREARIILHVAVMAAIENYEPLDYGTREIADKARKRALLQNRR